MKYEDIKKMGEAWAQVQEKQRQANVIRAEAMLKAEAEAISANVEESKKVDEKAPKVAKGKDASVKGIAKASDAYAKKLKFQKNDASNDKSDDGDDMDKVDPKAVKKKFKDRKDKDIDNDGDTDDSDEYLHKRRKAISKNSESKGKKEVEVQTQEKVKEDKLEEMDFVPMHLRPGGAGPKKPLTPAEKQARIQKRRDNLKKGLGYRSEMSDMEKTRAMATNSIGKPKPKTSGNKKPSDELRQQKEGEDIARKILRYKKDDAVKKIAKRNTSSSDIQKQKSDKMMRDRKRQQNNSVEEAASTGAGKNSDSVAQDKTDGMAPNAKDQLAKAMKTPAIDGQKAIDLTFASFKKMSGKKSKDNK